MSVVIEPNEIEQFIDAYRDGTIDEDSARKLAREIEKGGDASKKIIEEFEFNGLLSQALDNMSKENFVRNFLERMYAEKTGGEFTAVITEKTENSKTENSKRLPVIGLVHDLFFSHRQVSSASASASGPERRLRVVPILIVAAVVVCIALWRAPDWFGESTISLAEFSPGVVLTRGEAGVQPELNMTLNENDQIAVPEGGGARLYFDDSSWVLLESATKVTLMPDSIPKGPVGLGSGKAVVVQIGAIEIDVKAQESADMFQAISSFAIAETREAHFNISVTSTSLRLDVQKGTVNLIRLTDGKIVEVSGGQSIIASENTEFKAINVKPQSDATAIGEKETE